MGLPGDDQPAVQPAGQPAVQPAGAEARARRPDPLGDAATRALPDTFLVRQRLIAGEEDFFWRGEA